MSEQMGKYIATQKIPQHEGLITIGKAYQIVDHSSHMGKPSPVFIDDGGCRRAAINFHDYDWKFVNNSQGANDG